LANRYSPLDQVLIASTPDDKAHFASTIALDDLQAQIRSIKSAIELEHERQAQKWFVESFIDSGFEMRRHEFANSAMKVFSLGHRRARELFDLSLLEVRGTLWDETKHPAVAPVQLRGTSGRRLTRFSNFLSPTEFSRFCGLMRGLAPALVGTVHPPNKTGIQRGEWGPIRQNLLIILNGHPASRPLF
jgi:hypothetical protein